MKIVGFNFQKINAEKLGNKSGNLKVNTKINVSEIKKIKSDFLKAKEEFVSVDFTYDIDYNPGFAKLQFSGKAIFSMEPKETKNILKDWKNKKISEDFKILLFNIIIKKSSLKALELEEDLNLPFHLPFPSVRKEQKEK